MAESPVFDIRIPLIAKPSKDEELTTILKVITKEKNNTISFQPWATPRVDITSQFHIAHDGDNLYVVFVSEEKEIKAVSRKINDSVHKDNCVEMFISFGVCSSYYNIETNCLGNIKIAYGDQRTERKFIAPSLIEKIKSMTTLRSISSSSNLFWEILLIIPKHTFSFTDIPSFRKITAKGNFYKCGDDLTTPYFLTWKPIISASPDFHQKDFFGNLFFD